MGMPIRGLFAAFFLLFTMIVPAPAQTLTPVGSDSAEGQALIARLRAGGLVLFFRHADTRGA